jgi:hypothetical protein
MQYGALIPGGLAMGPVSRLRGYLYERGAIEDEARGLDAYGRLLGWIADSEERAWRVQADELERLLGQPTYPDLAEGEPVSVYPATTVHL